MGRRALRGPGTVLVVLAVVVTAVGVAWLSTGVDDDAFRQARPADPASAVPDGPGPTAPARQDADGPVPLGVSNALGAPVPEATGPQGVPRSVEDWVARVLPVGGPLAATVDGVAASVRIERLGADAVAVRVDGVTLPPEHRAVRLVLTSDPTPDLGALAHASALMPVPMDGTTAGGFSVVTDASSLQADTRSAALVDGDTDQVLGVALLVPVD